MNHHPTGENVMRRKRLRSGVRRAWFVAGLGSLAIAGFVLGNGGPFVIKYPNGDPAAKGVLARLDPDLKPARETRLQVVKEDLQMRFEPDQFLRSMPEGQRQITPLALVTANYWITNPTPETVTVEFGFPILRGIYVSPFSMMPRPEARVIVDGTNYFTPEIISNSAIYGALRRKAAADIERALEAEAILRNLANAYTAEFSAAAREKLIAHLVNQRHWNQREAALLADYFQLRPKAEPASPPLASKAAVQTAATPASLWWVRDASLQAATRQTAWAVQAIGEQKATQWLTVLAGRLDSANASSYEAIFQAWGGDVRERSVDLATGKVRPRLNSPADKNAAPAKTDAFSTYSDAAVYARVDYVEANKNLTPEQKAQWQEVVKNLPIVFTFAPMNLLHYQVAFAPGTVRTVKVLYQQYAYQDTAAPASYQMAYVLHPASLWESFGPIKLTVMVPTGVTPVSTLAFTRLEKVPAPGVGERALPPRLGFQAFTASVADKTGELFVGISAADWASAINATIPNKLGTKQTTAAQ
jgi:hypothetical protein